MEQETRCLNLSRDVYPEVAKRHQVNVSCVERDIRTMVEDCWLHGNRNLFHEIAGYELDHRPTVKRISGNASWLSLRKRIKIYPLL